MQRKEYGWLPLCFFPLSSDLLVLSWITMSQGQETCTSGNEAGRTQLPILLTHLTPRYRGGQGKQQERVSVQTKPGRTKMIKLSVELRSQRSMFHASLIYSLFIGTWGFLGGSDSKKSVRNAGEPGLIPGLGRSPGEGNGYTPVFLPGEFHDLRSLVGYSPWGCKELDTTQRVTLWLTWLDGLYHPIWWSSLFIDFWFYWLSSYFLVETELIRRLPNGI